MNELVPVLFGVLIGSAFGWARSRWAVAAAAVLAALAGVLASVVTGETIVSWGYVLIDIPIVTCAAVASALTARRLARRSPRTAM